MDASSVIGLYTQSTSTQSEHAPHVEKGDPTCRICADSHTQQIDSFIILSCNHMYHIFCLADVHFKDNYTMIDEAYLQSRLCPCCQKPLQREELMFLHSKFIASSKNKAEQHAKSISDLENQFNKIRDELRACYEYKQKLDNEREKSKQIIKSLMTII
jgi:hypothetical protein